MWCDVVAMERSVRSLLALAAAAFAALTMTFPSASLSASRADSARPDDPLGATDRSGAFRVASTSEHAAIAPLVRTERVWSKASNRLSRLLHSIGDLSSAPSAGAIVLAGLLLFGFASRFGGRPAVVASDPRAPPRHLQLR